MWVYKRKTVWFRGSIDAKRDTEKRNNDHSPLRSGNRGHMWQWQRNVHIPLVLAVVVDRIYQLAGSCPSQFRPIMSVLEGRERIR